MCQVGPKDEDVSSLELRRNPLLLSHPIGVKTIIRWIDRNIHSVATIDDFKPAIGHSGRINSEENSQMLYVFDVCVSSAVNMSCESSGTGKLVVDFLLEQKHVFSS